MKKWLWFIVAIALAGLIFWYGKKTAPIPVGDDMVLSPLIVSYSCDAGKSITATFTEGVTIPPAGPDMPPTPGGKAHITLSDGRTLDLAQTISADGVRYSNGDPSKKQGTPGAETFVFWSKGSGALVLENNVEKSYIGCIQVTNVSEDSNLTQIYSNSEMGFSIRFPEGYTVDEKYTYALNPTVSISGIKFTIPESMKAGTNLSSDSYISVEQLHNTKACTPEMFLEDAQPVDRGDDPGDGYEVATSSDAGAGNRYDQTVYALFWSGEGITQPCTAIRYYIHYGAIENYPEGAVRSFDRDALIKQFDAIRETLVVNQ